jgi:hypothetical protein
MKITVYHKNPINTSSYRLSDIPEGTYFYGSVAANEKYANKLFLKTYNEVVLVEEPQKTWSASGLLFGGVTFVKVSIKVEQTLTEEERDNLDT